MHELNLVYVFFRCLNFVLFIGAMVFLYRRYVAGSLLHALLQERTERALLAAKAITLRQDRQQSEKERKAQEHEGQLLFERMRQWAAVKNQMQQERQKLMNEREVHAVERQKKMARGYHDQRLQEALKEPIVQQTQDFLKKRYQDQSKQQQFLKHAIDSFAQESE